MKTNPSSEKKPDGDRYIKNAEDRFFFDGSSGIYKPKTCKGENKARKETNKCQRFWIATIISILTLLVVGYYAYYAKLQWCEMKNAADAAQKSATAAQLANINTASVVHETERPWIGIKEMNGNIQIGQKGPLDFRVTFINSGREPALKAHYKSEVSCDPKGSKPKIIYTERDALKDGTFVLVPQQVINGDFSDVDGSRICSQKNFELMRVEKGTLYFLGTVWYDDTFGFHHHTDYCASMKLGDKAPAPCKFHNEAD